jgi:hypothetical protein
MAKRGPKPRGPVSEEDFKQFESLLGIQCTLEEVASFYNVDVKTIQARCEEHYGLKFSQISEQKRANGKISLRRKQFQKAMDGNIVMLIWLGKQYLGQVDKVEAVHEDKKDPLDELTLEQLQAEIDKRQSRFAGVKLKTRDVSDYEQTLVEKAKGKTKK